MDSNLASHIKDGCLTIKATPKASANRIKIDGETVRVYVTAIPENGKANAAVIKLLSKALGVPKSALDIVRGESDKVKVIRINE